MALILSGRRRHSPRPPPLGLPSSSNRLAVLVHVLVRVGVQGTSPPFCQEDYSTSPAWWVASVDVDEADTPEENANTSEHALVPRGVSPVDVLEAVDGRRQIDQVGQFVGRSRRIHVSTSADAEHGVVADFHEGLLASQEDFHGLPRRVDPECTARPNLVAIVDEAVPETLEVVGVLLAELTMAGCTCPHVFLLD